LNFLSGHQCYPCNPWLNSYHFTTLFHSRRADLKLRRIAKRKPVMAK
jgi:hypothetical protein